MSTGLDAVYEEIKRLKLEGMDRVFIADSTMALLTPVATPSPPRSVNNSAAKIDLQAAVNSGPKPPVPEPQFNKRTPATKTTVPSVPPIIQLPDGDATTQMQWLEAQVKASKFIKQQIREDDHIVFGSGVLDADVLYCGEAPNEEEAKRGKPFQGESGELLTKILRAMGLSREAVYMTNILKWRPQHDKPYGNRPPTQKEMDYCLPYLKAQIEIIQPKVIIGLGNATILGLLSAEPNHKMAAIRGHWQEFEGIPLIFTFQPSYLLFNDTMKTKRMVWEDMLKVMKKIDLPISDKQLGYFLPTS
jgi:DNA polymerase